MVHTCNLSPCRGKRIRSSMPYIHTELAAWAMWKPASSSSPSSTKVLLFGKSKSYLQAGCYSNSYPTTWGLRKKDCSLLYREILISLRYRVNLLFNEQTKIIKTWICIIDFFLVFTKNVWLIFHWLLALMMFGQYRKMIHWFMQ